MEVTIKRFCEANELKYKKLFPEFIIRSAFNELTSCQEIEVINNEKTKSISFTVSFGRDIIQAKRVYKHLGGV